MKYYKHNSIPLEEIELGINETGFDEFGNYVKITMFEHPAVLVSTVLKDGEIVSEYCNENFLKAYWVQMNKKLSGYEVQDADEQED